MSTSVKRSEKQLPSKANFSTFLQLNCSNFGLNLCEIPYSYQNFQRNKVRRGLGQHSSKNMFPETIIHKIFETKSSFYVK